mmetsp:Transcript_36100/g.41098  ORF Transcript_36100/g.41098 Transcript_36100/m.41098 type:complete len:190 (-) Transcript_36100:183-752(-)
MCVCVSAREKGRDFGKERKSILSSKTNMENDRKLLDQPRSYVAHEYMQEDSMWYVNPPRLSVYQCQDCNSIIVDSTMQIYNQAAPMPNFLIFRATTATENGDEPFLINEDGSNPRILEHCVYNNVHCGHCKSTIGIFLVSTTNEVHKLRGLHLLDSRKLNVYTVETNFGDEDSHDTQMKLAQRSIPTGR